MAPLLASPKLPKNDPSRCCPCPRSENSLGFQTFGQLARAHQERRRARPGKSVNTESVWG